MQLNYTLLIVTLASFLVSAHSSAIKGHAQARSHEEAARSIKLAPQQQQSNNIDKAPKYAAAVAPVVAPAAANSAQPAPILESSKKVYNDESIRRSVSQQVAAAAPPSEQVAKSPAIVPGDQPIVQQPIVAEAQRVHSVVQPVGAAPVEQPAPSVVAPVVAKEVVASAPVAAPAAFEPKSAAIEKPMEKQAEEKDKLPQQTDRSAPIKDDKPASVAEVQKAPVVIVEHVVPAKIPEQQQAPIAAQPVVAIQPVAGVAAPSVPIVQADQPAVAAVVGKPPQQQPQQVAVVEQQSGLQAKKDEPAQAQAAEPIEVPAPDPGLVLSEPIDSTTKLLIDLDEHVQKFLPAEDKPAEAQPPKEQVLVNGVDYSPAAPVAVGSQASEQSVVAGKSSAPLAPYSSDSDPIVPPLPSLDGVEKAAGAVGVPAVGAAAASSSAISSMSGSSAPPASRQANHNNQNQQQVITQLLDQLDSLHNRIQDTINQLVARRRYVMSALLRPMGTYVRRVRTNLERLQNRVNQLQAAAVSVGGSNGNQGGNRPSGFVDAAAIETIRRRIDDISKRISDIVNRIRFSLTPTSAPLNNGRK